MDTFFPITLHPYRFFFLPRGNLPILLIPWVMLIIQGPGHLVGVSTLPT